MTVSAHIDQQTGTTGRRRTQWRSKFSLLNGPRAANTNCIIKNVAWQLREDGWLRCDFTYAATGTNDYIGVVFDYPENLVKSKTWLGNGPYHVWKNRLVGAQRWASGQMITITPSPVTRIGSILSSKAASPMCAGCNCRRPKGRSPSCRKIFPSCRCSTLSFRRRIWWRKLLPDCRSVVWVSCMRHSAHRQQIQTRGPMRPAKASQTWRTANIPARSVFILETCPSMLTKKRKVN